jgi:hypothetical protein
MKHKSMKWSTIWNSKLHNLVRHRENIEYTMASIRNEKRNISPNIVVSRIIIRVYHEKL